MGNSWRVATIWVSSVIYGSTMGRFGRSVGSRESSHMRVVAANGPRSVQHIAATLRLPGALGALELLV